MRHACTTRLPSLLFIAVVGCAAPSFESGDFEATESDGAGAEASGDPDSGDAGSGSSTGSDPASSTGSTSSTTADSTGTPGEASGDETGDEDTSDCGADLESDSQNCGSCGHDCLEGACVDGACEPVILLPLSYQSGPLTSDESWIYWIDRDDWTFKRVSKDGVEDDFVAEGAQTYAPQMTYGSGAVYYGTTSELRRIDTTDASVQVVISASDYPGWNGRFALDEDHVYFAADHLYALPMDGGEVVQLSTHVPNGANAHVAVDATSVYRSVVPWGATPPWILTVPKAGGEEALEILADGGDTGLEALGDELIALRRSWAGSECASTTWIDSVAPDGTVTALGMASYAFHPMSDARHTYFADSCSDEIFRIPRGGGPMEAVTEQNGAFFAADDEALYFWTLHALVKLAKPE
jgi:hypothetical protein